MEEITFNFQPQACITALASAISADLVTILFFGVRPCLYLPLHQNLPEGNYLWLIVLGVILGILAYVYQYALLNLRWWYSKVKFPNIYHSVIQLGYGTLKSLAEVISSLLILVVLTLPEIY